MYSKLNIEEKDGDEWNILDVMVMEDKISSSYQYVSVIPEGYCVVEILLEYGQLLIKFKDQNGELQEHRLQRRKHEEE